MVPLVAAEGADAAAVDRVAVVADAAVVVVAAPLNEFLIFNFVVESY